LTTPSRSSWRHALGEAYDHFFSDDNWAIASHVALSTILSLFPFLIVVAALAGVIGSEPLAQEVVRLIFEAWPEEVARPIAQEAHAVLTRPGTGTITIGLAVALWFASNGVEALRVALNRAYRAHESRHFLYRRLQSLFFVGLGAVGLLALAFLVVLGPILWAAAVAAAPWLEPLERTIFMARYLVAAVVLFVVLLAAHIWLPAGRRRIVDMLPGVAATLVTWLLTGIGFGFYLRWFAAYSATYAGLAHTMAAIGFLYLIGVFVLLGAELNAALDRRRDLKRAARAAAEPAARRPR
jgi:membrane protein